MKKIIVKIVDEKYEKKDDVEALIRYIAEDNYCGRAYNNYFGMRANNSKAGAEDILAVQNKYNKNPSTILRHIVISFGEDYFVSPGQVQEIADKIAEYYNNEYQVMYGIHDKNSSGENQIHIHMMVGSVNFRTGKILHEGIGELNEFKKYVEDVVESSKKKKILEV